MISNVEVPYPVDYKTGDHALLVAWVTTPPIFFLGGQITRDAAEKAAEHLKAENQPHAVLCLEDGTAVIAGLDEFKFDYRYDIKQGRFVDVSGYGPAFGGEGVESADTDQAAPDHGGEGVPGYVPDPDSPSPGDPSDEGDGDLGGLAAGPEPSDD